MTTHHLCNRKLLATMKPSAWILNSSRGAVVDQEALLEAPNPFALDVWEGEPQLHPEVLQRAVFATPHVAGYTMQGKANASAIVVEELARHFALAIEGWYPASVVRPDPHCPTWEELLVEIDSHYDIAAESRLLKSAPDRFEAFRDNYRYRMEFF